MERTLEMTLGYLSLNRGLANWGVNPRRWNRPTDMWQPTRHLWYKQYNADIFKHRKLYLTSRTPALNTWFLWCAVSWWNSMRICVTMSVGHSVVISRTPFWPHWRVFMSPWAAATIAMTVSSPTTLISKFHLNRNLKPQTRHSQNMLTIIILMLQKRGGESKTTDDLGILNLNMQHK